MSLEKNKFLYFKKINYLPVLVFVFLLFSTITFGQEKEAITQLTIKRLSIPNSTMEEALFALRKVDENTIIIGFEEVPRVICAYQRKPIKLDAKDINLKEVLDGFVKQDPRYNYELINNSVINVYPREIKDNRNSLLDIETSKTSIRGNYFLLSIIKQPYYWIPELREFMENSMRTYKAINKDGFNSLNEGARAGTPWNYQSNLYPSIDFEFQGKTVRNILNSLVLQGSQLSTKNGGKTLSWKYQFIIDPDAYTGLGGYPLWRQLGDETPQNFF